MKKKLLSIAILSSLVIIQSAYSQLNYLKSGTSNIPGIYTDLGTNGSPIATANFDNANSAPQNIGFTFNYNGTSFTQFILNTNGFIKLGNTNPSIDSLYYDAANSSLSGGVFNSTDPLDTNILCVFNHDLQAGTAPPEYRVYTSGTPGSQVCTIQYKNVREKTNSPVIQFDNMEFQIRLYETTNTIEFVYGTWDPAATGSSANKTAAVGLKGADNTDPELLVVSKVSSQQWSSSTFISGNYPNAPGFNFGKPTRPIPDAGRTFRFVQAFPKDAAVNLFTLGSIPKPYGAPRIDSAIVRNLGMDTLTNVSATLTISGANTFSNTKFISSLAPGASATIGFSPYTPTSLGVNDLSVSITNDNNNTNNTDTYTQIVNNTVYSYADTTKATDGLGGSLPGYLTTRYTITGTTSVTGANIFIANNVASIGKTVYAILFDELGNKIDSSAALTITAADTGKYNYFSLPLVPSFTNASFYIGLAQPTVAVNYYPLGYQSEKAPVRLGAYFIRSMNMSFFTDLGGANSLNPYRLMIQAVVTNTTGVLKNVSENTLIVFPNPFSTTTTFKIQSDNVTGFSLNLYDITGKIVKTINNITTPELKLEKGDLSAGMYFYTVNSAEKMIHSGKLIAE